MKTKVLSILLCLTFSFGFCSTAATDLKDGVEDPFIVVLDAGHGGHDPGNLGNGYLEKRIALNIVLKVGEILSKNKDIKVIYTRKDDTFIDLYVRGEIANKANADLFVSVHCDSHTSDAHGAGTFVLGLHANKQNFEIAKKENSVIYLEDNYENRYADYDINSPESVIGLTIMQEEFLDQSIALAKMIQDNFSNKLKRTDRKVKQAGFIVLHQTFMPSVLVETGFLTNKDEGAYLNSSKGQEEMGKSIADAILRYKDGFKPEEEIVTTNVAKEIVEPIIEQKDTVTETVVVESKLETKSKDIPQKIQTKDIAENKTLEPKKIKEAISEKEVTSSVIFRVQLLATSKNIPLLSENFKGLSKISKEPYKTLYRYMYGETRSYREAKMLQGLAANKGYTTSYIVAYKLGERIPLKDAVKDVSDLTP